MKIIDFEQKGNVVRFYLGDNNLEDYWGDDWNDVSYEHNAGEVYDKFVSGYFDVSFDFDDVVYQPASGWDESGYCKNDMKARKVPCICFLRAKDKEPNTWYTEWRDISTNAAAYRVYFGDGIEVFNGLELNTKLILLDKEKLNEKS